jgi:hypothetical protein
VDHAIGDQFRGEQDRVISGRVPGGGLPDELPRCRRDLNLPGEGRGPDVLVHVGARCRPHRRSFFLRRAIPGSAGSVPRAMG